MQTFHRRHTGGPPPGGTGPGMIDYGGPDHYHGHGHEKQQAARLLDHTGGGAAGDAGFRQIGQEINLHHDAFTSEQRNKSTDKNMKERSRGTNSRIATQDRHQVVYGGGPPRAIELANMNMSIGEQSPSRVTSSSRRTYGPPAMEMFFQEDDIHPGGAFEYSNPFEAAAVPLPDGSREGSRSRPQEGRVEREMLVSRANRPVHAQAKDQSRHKHGEHHFAAEEQDMQELRKRQDHHHAHKLGEVLQAAALAARLEDIRLAQQLQQQQNYPTASGARSSREQPHVEQEQRHQQLMQEQQGASYRSNASSADDSAAVPRDRRVHASSSETCHFGVTADRSTTEEKNKNMQDESVAASPPAASLMLPPVGRDPGAGSSYHNDPSMVQRQQRLQTARGQEEDHSRVGGGPFHLPGGGAAPRAGQPRQHLHVSSHHASIPSLLSDLGGEKTTSGSGDLRDGRAAALVQEPRQLLHQNVARKVAPGGGGAATSTSVRINANLLDRSSSGSPVRRQHFAELESLGPREFQVMERRTTSERRTSREQNRKRIADVAGLSPEGAAAASMEAIQRKQRLAAAEARATQERTRGGVSEKRAKQMMQEAKDTDR
ncbi:unnamed protein product [Amoebophrya sp. A120]|nr:unnamed protein product [Amoebophrya sp. A120]|eukprot:GSA120T00012637001.1